MKRKKSAPNSHPDLLGPDAAAMLLTGVFDQAEATCSSAGGGCLRGPMWQTIQRSLLVERRDYVTVQHDQAEWVPLFPMVEMKVLCSIGKVASFLLRLQPGARLPAHDHLEAEECLILEGELDLGGVVLHTGDYHMAPRGLAHGMAISRLGALIFLRSDLPAYQL